MIYLDNAATTKTAPEVLEAMLPYFSEYYGNASSIYGLASASKKAVNTARRILAESIGAQMNEIYFTSGGTEADNWALKAAAEAFSKPGSSPCGRHIITTKIEHHAVLHTCEYLAKKGFEITYLNVDEYGLVNPSDVEAAIRPDTILLSVMFANNEIGTIEPIQEIGAIAKKHGILFHTDAVQAYGHLPIHVDELSIDMLSTSAHKIGGPKGIGFLYIRNSVKLPAWLHGGEQERSRRAGTENVPGIAGFGKAAELCMAKLSQKAEKEKELRDYLIDRLLKEIPDSRLNGHPLKRLPGNVNVSFPNVEGEALLIRLDMQGICASSGSACATGSIDPSHVLLAIGLSAGEAKGSLRLTLSEENTVKELDETVEAVKTAVEKLRKARFV